MNPLDPITKEHLLKAKELIDQEEIPAKFKGRDYAVEISGKQYPFKYLIMKAYNLATGETITPDDFGSSETLRNKFEKDYGFKIINLNTMDLSNFIAAYKELIKTERYNEVYKWEVVKNSRIIGI